MINAEQQSVGSRPRRRWWLLAIPLLVMGAFFFVLFLSLNAIAGRATKKLCEDAFHVPVTIGKIDFQMRRGMAAIDRFSLGNPSGFDEPVALSFLRLDGFVSVPSLLGRGDPNPRSAGREA